MMDYLDLDFNPIFYGEDLTNLRLHYTHYPVVDRNSKLLGILDLDELEIYPDIKLEIQPELLVNQEQHILFSMMRMKELDTDILFLVENGTYIGAITYKSIMHYLQDKLSISHEASFLTMLISPYVFSLSELSRIVESEGLKVIFFSTRRVDIENMEVSVVLDSNDLRRITGILEHKGYQIIHCFNETGIVDHLKSRYENLMTYLNV